MPPPKRDTPHDPAGSRPKSAPAPAQPLNARSVLQIAYLHPVSAGEPDGLGRADLSPDERAARSSQYDACVRLRDRVLCQISRECGLNPYLAPPMLSGLLHHIYSDGRPASDYRLYLPGEGHAPALLQLGLSERAVKSLAHSRVLAIVGAELKKSPIF